VGCHSLLHIAGTSGSVRHYVIVDQDNRRNQATPNGLSSPRSWGRFRSGCANEKPGSEAGLIANIPS
jgi:hypothetical protein